MAWRVVWSDRPESRKAAGSRRAGDGKGEDEDEEERRGGFGVPNFRIQGSCCARRGLLACWNGAVNRWSLWPWLNSRRGKFHLLHPFRSLSGFLVWC